MKTSPDHLVFTLLLLDYLKPQSNLKKTILSVLFKSISSDPKVLVGFTPMIYLRFPFLAVEIRIFQDISTLFEFFQHFKQKTKELGGLFGYLAQEISRAFEVHTPFPHLSQLLIDIKNQRNEKAPYDLHKFHHQLNTRQYTEAEHMFKEHHDCFPQLDIGGNSEKKSVLVEDETVVHPLLTVLGKTPSKEGPYRPLRNPTTLDFYEFVSSISGDLKWSSEDMQMFAENFEDWKGDPKFPFLDQERLLKLMKDPSPPPVVEPPTTESPESPEEPEHEGNPFNPQNLPMHVATSLLTLVDLHLRQDNLSKAKGMVEEALNYMERLNTEYATCTAVYCLSYIQWRIGNYSDASRLLQGCLNRSVEDRHRGFPFLQEAILFGLAELQVQYPQDSGKLNYTHDKETNVFGTEVSEQDPHLRDIKRQTDPTSMTYLANLTPKLLAAKKFTTQEMGALTLVEKDNSNCPALESRAHTIYSVSLCLGIWALQRNVSVYLAKLPSQEEFLRTFSHSFGSWSSSISIHYKDRRVIGLRRFKHLLEANELYFLAELYQEKIGVYEEAPEAQDESLEALLTKVNECLPDTRWKYWSQLALKLTDTLAQGGDYAGVNKLVSEEYFSDTVPWTRSDKVKLLEKLAEVCHSCELYVLEVGVLVRGIALAQRFMLSASLAGLWIRMARIYLQAYGELSEAQRILTSLTPLEKPMGPFYELKGEMALFQEDYQTALKFYTQASQETNTPKATCRIFFFLNVLATKTGQALDQKRYRLRLIEAEKKFSEVA